MIAVAVLRVSELFRVLDFLGTSPISRSRRVFVGVVCVCVFVRSPVGIQDGCGIAVVQRDIYRGVEIC